MRLHVISRQFGQPPRRHQVDVERGLPHCVVIVPNALAILAIDHAGSGIVEDDVDRTKASRACDTRLTRSAFSPASAVTASALPPSAALISAAIRSSRSPERAEITTLAPSSA